MSEKDNSPDCTASREPPGSQQSYNLAKEKNIDVALGALGENIYIDINPYMLPFKTLIQIGEVEFEITQHCTLCKGLATLHKDLPKLLKEDRGVFIRALNSGTITREDKVIVKSLGPSGE